MRWRDAVLVAVLPAALSGCLKKAPQAEAEPALVVAKTADDGSCADYNPSGNAYFGDTHVHTAFSLDGYAFGVTRPFPRDAIRFAAGEPIEHPLGGKAQIDRPLDFVVITDHAEFFGELGACILDPENPAWNDPFCRDLRADPLQGLTLITALTFNIPPQLPEDPDAVAQGRQVVWNEIRNQINAGHEACRLTTLVGYEWTGGTAGGQTNRGNLHRNVIFSNSVGVTDPPDARRFPDEASFWQALDDRCDSANGCDAIVIPHNSNLSREGAMWDLTGLNAVDRARRRRFERLVEIYQHKGDSECDNFNLDPGDAAYDRFCDFEKITFKAIPDAGLGMNFTGDLDRRKSMVRHGLALGLNERAAGRDNPLQLGIIASTDTHNATAGMVSEATYRGNHARFWEDDDQSRVEIAWERSPGGLAGVWAEANTRRAIFAALKRRETFGTSGPRIRVRTFALPQSDPAICSAADVAARAIAAGATRMGGEVTGAGAAHLVVVAEADAVPLERIQIIRLRSDEGVASEMVTDVAVFGGGAQRACVTWSDPDFRSGSPSLYYARVLEQPTRRWSAYACERLGRPASCLAEAPEQIQERAWSSPIWYAP